MKNSKTMRFWFTHSLAIIAMLTIQLSTLSSMARATSDATVSTLGIANHTRLFSKPTDIALLKDGSLLVIDEAEYKIKRVVGEQVSTWTTFESKSAYYHSGDEPCALEVDKSDQVFVVNCAQTKLYTFSSDGKLLKTTNIALLGVKDRGFDWGPAMALDSRSNIYLSDERNAVILRVNPSTGVTENYVGAPGITGNDSGRREQVPLKVPRGLAIDKNDNLYIVDLGVGRVRVVDSNGNASLLPLTLCAPNQLLLNSDELIVMSEYYCGQKISSIKLGSFQLNPIVDDTLTGISNVPYGMTGKPPIGIMSSAGAIILPARPGQESQLVVSDGHNGNLKYFDLKGNLKRVLGGQDTLGVIDLKENTPLYNIPHSIFALDDGSFIVLDMATAKLVNNAGQVERYLQLPWSCAEGSTISGSGDVHCVWGNRIQVRFADGTLKNIGTIDAGFADGRDSEATFNSPSVSRGSNDDILISDSGNHSIRLMERDQGRNSFQVSTIGGKTGPIRPDFSQSKSAAVFSWPSRTALAPDRSIFVTEGGWDRLRKIEPGSSGLVNVTGGNFKSWPVGIAVDGTGVPYISTERGFIYTLKTNALLRMGGNGPGVKDGPLSDALFYKPLGLAVDRNGSLLVADSQNHIIRRIDGLNLTPGFIYSRNSLSKLINAMTVVIKSSANNNSTTSGKPPTPSFSGVNFAGNKINIAVNVGTNSATRPDKVYLVAPKLGFTASNPLAGAISGSSATWSVSLDKLLAGTMIPLEVVSEKNGLKSESASATYKAPPILSETTKVPDAPKNYKQRIVGSTAVITVEAILKNGAIATDSYLLSKTLGITKSGAQKGEVIGTKVVFEMPIKASMAGKRFPLTIYLSNEIGNSKPLGATLIIPAAPKAPSIPNVTIKPPKNPDTVICVRSSQTRAFSGTKCPPGWEQG